MYPEVTQKFVSTSNVDIRNRPSAMMSEPTTGKTL
jgi:hypothetical protein